MNRFKQHAHAHMQNEDSQQTHFLLSKHDKRTFFHIKFHYISNLKMDNLLQWKLMVFNMLKMQTEKPS